MCGCGKPDDRCDGGREIRGGERPQADGCAPEDDAEGEEGRSGHEHDHASYGVREVVRTEADQQRDAERGLDHRVDLDHRPSSHQGLLVVCETTVERMGRPVNPHRKSETLGRAAEYVLARGLAGLSLRPLATALDTSPRMLLYDFGSKQRLVADVLAEIRRREERLFDARVETLEDVWRWIAAPEREAFLRLFFEVYVDAMKRDEASPFVEEWLAFLSSRVDEATATLMIAVVRGLLLDRLATGDKKRTDAALELAARTLPGL